MDWHVHALARTLHTVRSYGQYRPIARASVIVARSEVCRTAPGLEEARWSPDSTALAE